jgi:hypothetical protein
VVLYSQLDIFPYFLLWRYAFTFSAFNPCQKKKFPVDRWALQTFYRHLATGPQTEAQRHFPLFRSITIASQFARNFCLFRLFVQLACFAAIRMCRLTRSSHCVSFQPATLWDHVASEVACTSNWAPAVRQFDTHTHTHISVHVACRNTAALSLSINSQTGGISGLLLYILLLVVVRVHVPAIL